MWAGILCVHWEMSCVRAVQFIGSICSEPCSRIGRERFFVQNVQAENYYECSSVRVLQTKKSFFGKVAISRNREFFAWVSYSWPIFPANGISRITLGRSDRKESYIFGITFSIRFCCFRKC